MQGLGDSLETTPLLSTLRYAFPSARIDVAVSRPSPAEFFSALVPLIDDVISLPYWDHGSIVFVMQLLRSCRRRLYDASFMTYPSAKRPYHVVNALFRAHRKIGHRYAPPSLQNMLRSYTNLVPIRAVHNVERNLDLLTPLGISRPADIRYAVPLTWNDMPCGSSDLVTIHIGTISHDGFEHKRWPLKRFIELARVLVASGARVSAIAGPEERAETSALCSEVPEIGLVCGSLEDVAKHLARSTVVIANDSGIGHLAVAMGAPTISLFGPTPVTGAPYGPLAVTLRPSPCPPCFEPLASGITCVRDIDFQCIRRDLTVKLVIESVNRLLEIKLRR